MMVAVVVPDGVDGVSVPVVAGLALLIGPVVMTWAVAARAGPGAPAGVGVLVRAAKTRDAKPPRRPLGLRAWMRRCSCDPLGLGLGASCCRSLWIAANRAAPWSPPYTQDA